MLLQVKHLYAGLVALSGILFFAPVGDFDTIIRIREFVLLIWIVALLAAMLITGKKINMSLDVVCLMALVFVVTCHNLAYTFFDFPFSVRQHVFLIENVTLFVLVRSLCKDSVDQSVVYFLVWLLCAICAVISISAFELMTKDCSGNFS